KNTLRIELIVGVLQASPSSHWMVVRRLVGAQIYFVLFLALRSLFHLILDGIKIHDYL
ncbi:unnamed protein product, partial [Musa acuminata subsp. burmannicoides]